MTALAMALVGGPALAQQQPADLIVINANIWTADVNRPRAEAMAVRGNRIAFVGSRRGAEALRGPDTRVMDVHGMTVVPGLVDAHAHLLGLGQALRNVDLVGTTSYDSVIARVAARARTVPTSQWIRGRGWDQNDWADTHFPTHEALSRAVPDHPVILGRVDGHAILVNARAMQLAGITRRTPDPSGGHIVRNANGDATGVFVDNATGLIERVVPDDTPQETRAAILAATAEANRWGLTGIHDAGVSAATFAIYEDLARQEQFTLRDYVMLRDSESVEDRFLAQPQHLAEYDRLWMRSIKLYADGALGSRGAALLEPYDDDPGNTGLTRISDSTLRRIAVKALRAGWQVNVHAIGDRANRMVLDAYEWALQQVPVADHRFRIEHAQIINYQDIPRFAQLDVIPSMQGSHQTSDMYWAPNRIGWSRSQGSYAWRSLLNTGVIIPNGSDFPVESPNPLISFHSFFTRQDADNYPPGGWIPNEKTTRMEAFLSMTMWPAYASFLEDVSGSLTAGKYADFVVLDQDIMTVAPEDVLKTQVVRTVLGGRVVYERSSE